MPEPTIGRALALTLYARHHVEPGEIGAQTSVAEVEPVSPQTHAQPFPRSGPRPSSSSGRPPPCRPQHSHRPRLPRPLPARSPPRDARGRLAGLDAHRAQRDGVGAPAGGEVVGKTR